MLLGWCVVAIDFPSFMELRFIDMKEKWLLTSSLLARERNERLSKTSKAELDGAISILASLPRSTEAAAARTAITQPHITYTTHVHFFPTQSGITRLRRRVSRETSTFLLPQLIALLKLRSLKRFRVGSTISFKSPFLNVSAQFCKVYLEFINECVARRSAFLHQSGVALPDAIFLHECIFQELPTILKRGALKTNGVVVNRP